MTELVWIDTDLSIELSGAADPLFDPSARPRLADVDDGYAIVELFNTAELAVCGISTVMGNTSAWDAYIRVQYLVREFGPAGLDLFLGTSVGLKLNDRFKESLNLLNQSPEFPRHLDISPAIGGLSAALDSLNSHQRMKILCIGAATNVAAVLLAKPELAGKVSEIVCVAGRSSFDQHFGPELNPKGIVFRDLNSDADPDAFRVLLENDVPLVFTGAEVASHVWITPEDLETFASGPPAARFLASASQF